MAETARQRDAVEPARAEAFAGRLLNALNDGGLCLMVSIGHRTGLFDTMSRSGAGTSADIAERAGLDERYVREWLGAMVTGGVVEYEPGTAAYRLPPEHAGSLTRAAAADNMAVFAQYIGSLGAVEDEIVACFRDGGGVPYSKYPRFHEVMAEDSGQSVLSSLESHILPLVPGLTDRLEAGIEVLDLGCGRGLVLARLAALYPASRFAEQLVRGAQVMPSVAEHYRNVLAEVYSWMLGGFDEGIRRNVAFFERHGIGPRGSGLAVDLGAGCGFQAIPLARAGFTVTAIDLDRALLDELERRCGDAGIATVTDDLMRFDAHIDGPVELIVCMTDTLLHLEAPALVDTLFRKVHAALEPGGRFIATFRDLSSAAEELDRFIAVRSDDTTILTCFLEYEPERVKVHDLVYRKQDGQWRFSRSYYRKLRLAADDVRDRLVAAGFDSVRQTVENGLVTVIAARS